MTEEPEPATAGCEVVLDADPEWAGEVPPDLLPWLVKVLSSVAPQAQSFGVRCTGSGEVAKANERYRGIDGPTDVLSFPGQQTPEGLHLGDVLLSMPTAQRQATELGHSLERELKELLLHGVLHCLGHDHEQDEGEMDRLEQIWRDRFLEGEGA